MKFHFAPGIYLQRRRWNFDPVQGSQQESQAALSGGDTSQVDIQGQVELAVAGKGFRIQAVGSSILVHPAVAETAEHIFRTVANRQIKPPGQPLWLIQLMCMNSVYLPSLYLWVLLQAF